jgi:hypothetical protein
LIALAHIYLVYYTGRKHAENLGATAVTRFNGSQRIEEGGVKTGFM